MSEAIFGSLFKKYRKLSGYKTLGKFADALADEGLIYSESLLSRWQKNLRLPRDRDVFLILIRLFIKKGAILNIFEANELLSAAGMGYLSPSEVEKILHPGRLKVEMHIPAAQMSLDKEEKHVKVSLILPKNLNKYLDWVATQYQTNKSEAFRQIIDRQINST